MSPELVRIPVGPVRANCFLLSCPGRDDCLLIDPGAEPEVIRRAVGEKKIAAILLTHGHFDHIGAVDALMATGTRLLIHEADAPMLPDPQLNASWLLGEEIFCRSNPEAFTDGDTLEAAGFALQVLHTPGHTPGGVCFVMDDVIFTGDTVMAGGVGRTDLPGGSEQALRASLRRLAPLLQGRRVYGGHS